MNANELSRRMDLAVEIARAAGQLTLRYFQQTNYQVEFKADASPVTVADREAEALLRERITAIFPQDAILGEELGEQSGTTGFRWILDPIDGTKSFISGVPLYGTLVGIEAAGEGIGGVIYIPGLDEAVWGTRGGQAWHRRGTAEPTAAKVSARDTLREAIFCTSQVDSFDKTARTAAYSQLQAQARITRTWGDCYGYLLVATGRADLMVDPIMNIWDAAALLPILEAAGGTFTDWRGAATIQNGEGIATNGRLLAEVLAITSPMADAGK